MRPTGQAIVAGTDYDGIEIVRGEEGRRTDSLLEFTKWAAIPCNQQKLSLFLIKNSLFRRAGNRSAKPWFASQILPEISPTRPERAKFPVIFPVSREFDLWRPVRLRLRPPPRSPLQTEISRLVANSPELAGIRVRILSLQAVELDFTCRFGAFVSAPKNRVSKSGEEATAAT
jgi:hypothetical protein